MIYQTDKVTVIIFTRNGGQPLINTLNSIFLQTYKNIEVFLIVDAVTEKFLDGIKIYKQLIRSILKQKTFSKGRVLNEALKVAKGRYFSILNAGDIWHRESLEQKVSFLEKNKNAFAVSCDFGIFDKKGMLNSSFFESRKVFSGVKYGKSFIVDEAQKFIVKVGLRLFSTTLIKNESYLFFGPFDESALGYPDSDLFFKIVKNSRLGCIKRALTSKYFDIYKVAYYINENMKNKITYLEYVLGSLSKEDRKYESDIKLLIEDNYVHWADYLLKKKEKLPTRRVALEGMAKHSVNPKLMWLLFRSFLPDGIGRGKDQYDYFWTDKVKEDLIKLHF